MLGISFGSSLAVVSEYSISDTTKNEAPYSYLPTFDFTPEEESYELVADRLSCIENEIPLIFNTRVYSFINYFAFRDREYTKGVMVRQELFFPIFEKRPLLLCLMQIHYY